jgi:hypothetical protein
VGVAVDDKGVSDSPKTDIQVIKHVAANHKSAMQVGKSCKPDRTEQNQGPFGNGQAAANASDSVD